MQNGRDKSDGGKLERAQPGMNWRGGRNKSLPGVITLRGRHRAIAGAERLYVNSKGTSSGKHQVNNRRVIRGILQCGLTELVPGASNGTGCGRGTAHSRRPTEARAGAQGWFTWL